MKIYLGKLRKIKELYKKRTTLQQAQIQLNNVSFKNNVIAICKELFLDVNEIINCKNQYSDKVLQNTYINKDQLYDNIEKEIVKIKENGKWLYDSFENAINSMKNNSIDQVDKNFDFNEIKKYEESLNEHNNDEVKESLKTVGLHDFTLLDAI